VVAHCITADAREGTASSIGVLDSSSGDVGKMLESATSILNSGVILFQTARWWCCAPLWSLRDCSMFRMLEFTVHLYACVWAGCA
jgi:hypothetical protein